jgi:hypothetical protein
MTVLGGPGFRPWAPALLGDLGLCAQCDKVLRRGSMSREQRLMLADERHRCGLHAGSTLFSSCPCCLSAAPCPGSPWLPGSSVLPPGRASVRGGVLLSHAAARKDNRPEDSQSVCKRRCITRPHTQQQFHVPGKLSMYGAARSQSGYVFPSYFVRSPVAGDSLPGN